MEADRPDGTGTTNELASTQYQMWVDSARNKALCPDIEGTCDGTSGGFLVDSTNAYATHLVKAGDIVFNTKDLTQTTVATTPTVDTDPLDVTDDIFVNGDTYKIRMLSPTGLGAYKARIGAAYNNSGSDLDDSTYTQIQDPKYYSGTAGDFTVTLANWTTNLAVIQVSQYNNWTGLGNWRVEGNIQGTLSVGSANIGITISGITWPGSNQAISASSTAVASIDRQFTTAPDGMNLSLGGANTVILFSFNTIVAKKPTFAK